MSSSRPGIRFGRFELRPAQRSLLVDGQPANLGARAFDVRVDVCAPQAEPLFSYWGTVEEAY